MNKKEDVWTVDDLSLDVDNFNGKPVVDIDSDNITDPSAVALLVRDVHKVNEGTVEYDHYKHLFGPEVSPDIAKLFEKLVNYEDLSSIDTLVVGTLSGRYSDVANKMQSFLDLLCAYECFFPNLKALFIGGTSLNDWDISDIRVCKLDKLLNKFTQLEYLKVRGVASTSTSDGLGFIGFFSEAVSHPNLQKLVIETSSINAVTIDSLAKSDLPKLAHLELWFGEFEYQKEVQRELLTKVKALLRNDFPSLSYLGLRNSDMADKMARALAKSDILGQIDELDLSLGSLTRAGVQALRESPSGEALRQRSSYRSIKNKALGHELPKADFGLAWRKGSYCEVFDTGSNVFMYE